MVLITYFLFDTRLLSFDILFPLRAGHVFSTHRKNAVHLFCGSSGRSVYRLRSWRHPCGRGRQGQKSRLPWCVCQPSPTVLAANSDHAVNENVARNCTDISPCQQDSTIIRDAEITQNIVNGCGRTQLNGNIDIGEQTENELAANRMTKVAKGSSVAVTIHQVNADGAGPYECDLDESSNVGAFTKLQVSNNVPGENGLSDAKFKDFTINVQMPDNLNCTGGEHTPFLQSCKPAN